MKPKPYRGDNCRFLDKMGETWVPWGDTMVKLGGDYKCGLGYDATYCDCPNDVPEPVDHYRRGYQRARDAGVD